MRGQPSGDVCFLFTDIEGSTRLWAEHTAAMEIALTRHDELIYDAIIGVGGYIFSTGGDGVGAAFASPDAGIRAAIAAQVALQQEPWDQLPHPLRVRMGLHRGVVQERADNYFGPAVNLAARVMSAAWGGQVLCTDAIAGVGVADVEALGEHRLRDVPESVALFEIVVAGSAAAFPPPRTLDQSPSTLPAQRSTFLGRHEDVAHARRILLDHRLLTFTGPGGVGKTRLAVEVAGREQPRRSDGCFFVDLTAVDGRIDLAATVAGACRVDLDASGAPLEQLTATLASRDCLIVFDNCEHVLDPVAVVIDRILDECPSVRVIATSREAIGLAGEQLAIVGALGANGGTAATKLFVERAAAVGREFELDDPDVAQLCEHLDGMPLAIELAAARTVTLSPAEITARLERGIDSLAARRRGGPERHRTLRATTEWSYHLLDAGERELFDRCSVFAGSFDLAAVAAVSNVDVESSTELLEGLVLKSMVVATADAAEAHRFRLLDTLRSFAREQLETRPDDAKDARDAHALHYLARLGALPPSRNLARDLREAFEPDLGNILAALDRVDVSTSSALSASRAVSDPLVCLLTHLGLFDQARSRCDRALAGELDDGSRGRLLLARAYVDATQDGTSDFALNARRALEYLRPGDGLWGAAVGMTSIVEQMFGPERAVDDLEAALASVDGTGPVNARHDAAVLRFYLGGALMSARRYERAVEAQIEAALLLDEVEPTSLIRLWSASGAAMSLTLLGRHDEATAVLDDVAPLAGWTDWSVEWFFARAYLSARQGDFDAARRTLGDIGARFAEGSVSPMVGTVVAGFAIVAYLEGRRERAESLIDIVTATRATASTSVLYETIGAAQGWADDDFPTRRLERVLDAASRAQPLGRAEFFAELGARLHKELRGHVGP